MAIDVAGNPSRSSARYPSTGPLPTLPRMRGRVGRGRLPCHCLQSRARYRDAGPVRDHSARLSVLSVPAPSLPSPWGKGKTETLTRMREGEEGGAREHARIDAAAEELAVKEILRTNDVVLVSAV